METVTNVVSLRVVLGVKKSESTRLKRDVHSYISHLVNRSIAFITVELFVIIAMSVVYILTPTNYIGNILNNTLSIGLAFLSWFNYKNVITILSAAVSRTSYQTASTFATHSDALTSKSEAKSTTALTTAAAEDK
jgi:hypothetical protein